MRRPAAQDIFRARQNRQSPTAAEQILWQLLRRRGVGNFKFRRQHPLGPYCVDFYCAACRLVVELDGSSHRGRAAYDRRRQQWLEEQGLFVLRFSNEKIEAQAFDVLVGIELVCRALFSYGLRNVSASNRGASCMNCPRL
jgi:very-short-patch-repair endonuclease